MSRVKWIFVFATSCLVIFAAYPQPATAQSEVALERIQKHAVNRPLASLRDAARAAEQRPIRRGPPREVLNFRGEGAPELPDLNAPDILLQDIEAATALTSIEAGFPGAGNADNGRVNGYIVAPPDTDGHVGPNHFVQMINSLTTIYNKNGNALLGPIASNAFWVGIGGNCEPYNQGDPIVLYDEVADRWLLSQFAFPDNLSSFSQCVAISQTGDPTGGYNRYEFDFDDIGLNDYPKHGIVDGAITMIANLFRKRGGGPFAQYTFAGTFLGAMDKVAMYAGDPATLVGQNIGTGQFGFLPADLDGGGSSPALFATAMSTANSFDIWEASFDFGAGSFNAGLVAQVPIAPFDADLCSASREACIPQPNNGPALEAITDRLMHRLQVRDFGAYKAMVTGHTVDVGSGRAGIRWYEFRDSGAGWSLYQQGTYAGTDSDNRWMPSVAMNAAGDIGIGYLIASANTFVSIGLNGQSAAGSGSGVLDAGETICALGSGVQEDTGRSGDYSATSVDPVTDTFWHTNEVVKTTGQFSWDTFVCEFSVGDGTPPPNNPPTAGFDSSCTDLSCGFTDTSTDSDGTVTAWSWDFGDGNGSSAQNPNHIYAAGGTYTVTLTATDDDGATDSATGSVTVSEPTPNTPPTASFTAICTDLSCDFTDASTDSDGTVTGWSWDFGDGAGTSTQENPSYTYGAAGEYTVTLIATDDDGADSASFSDTVTATDPPVTPISLSAIGFKYRGRHAVDLTWSGAGGTSVDIFRDAGLIATTANDGAYTDNIGTRGAVTYVYQVCEAGTSTCSNLVTVVFE